jgi:hypothetical protein
LYRHLTLRSHGELLEYIGGDQVNYRFRS